MSNRFCLYFGKVIIFLTLFSCEEAVDWTFQPAENGQVAVEAIITNELVTQEVKLSFTFDNLSEQALPVSDAQIYLTDGQQEFLFVEKAAEPGVYLSEQAFAVQAQKSYQLNIEWSGQNYQAESRLVDVLPMGPIKFKAEGADSLSIEEVAPLYALNEQAMYEVDIDWTHLIPSDTSRAKQFFYTLSTVDVNELFRPPKEKVVFPKGSIITEKKYALNPEFAAYIRAFLMETEWQGGIYDENSNRLPTNINNGGVGFFAVAAVLTDTLIAE